MRCRGRLPPLSAIALATLLPLALDLIVGHAGVVTLGHAALFGFGAHAAGILAQRGFGDPILGLLAAMPAAGLLGLVTAPPAPRVGDLAGLTVTPGLSLMLHAAANRLHWLTGGADGLQGMAVGPVLGLGRFDMVGRTAYPCAPAVLFVRFPIARLVTASPFGLSLRGIRGNARRAAALGVPVRRRLGAAYVLAAAYAGAAGAVMAQTTQFVSLDALSFQRTADGLLMPVPGGLGSLNGALLGAAAFTVAHRALSEASPLVWRFWLGIGLVALALALAGRGGGLPGLLTRITRRRAR